MTVFSYRGRDKQGKLVTGTLDVASSAEVVKQLISQGVVPVDITQARFTINWRRLANTRLFNSAPRRQELAAFARQIYTLYKAGVSLSVSLERIASTTENPQLEGALRQMCQAIESGMSMADSMQQQARLFPSLFVNMVRVGEESGRLEESFFELSKYFELEDTTIKQLHQALRYPAIVTSAIVIAFVVITVFVIPAFATLFASYSTKLPWATILLIDISNFMRNYWWLLLGILLLSAIGFSWYKRTVIGRINVHRWQLKIPAVGNLIQKIIFARFARTFAMIMRTGLAMHVGIELVARTLNNAFIEDKLLAMRHDLARGESLVVSAERTQVFPKLVLQMLTVGEEAGSLDDILDQMADYYELEVEYGLRRLKDALEPLLLLFIGVMVLILALGVFLPMWNMSRLVKGA